MWTADLSILLFTGNSVLGGQHSGVFQYIDSLLKPCYMCHEREKQKQKTISLPLQSLPILKSAKKKSLPIHSQIHDFARFIWLYVAAQFEQV